MNKEIIICPFYKGEGECTIKCQGIYVGTENIIKFLSKKKKTKHRVDMCETFEYIKCMHAKRLMEEYK